MKVLHVIETLGRGGAEQVLLTLLPELARQGCQAEVAVCRPPYDLQAVLEQRGIPVHRLPFRKKWNLLGQARAVAHLAGGMGADVVHAHLYFPAVTTALMRVLRLCRARTCVTFHNLAYAGANKAGPGLLVKKRLAALLYPRGFDRMFAVSLAVAQHYESALGMVGVKVCHNPIDVPAVPTMLRSRSIPRVVVPGRLVPEKGHQSLIAALFLLKTPVNVTFAGGGPLAQELANAAPDVRITGPLPHDEMLTEIAQADLVVIPSIHEGFGLTALEAMALGRPVIATRAGGLPEVLGDTGLLVPVGDSAALAQAIQGLLDDPERCISMGRAGRERAQGQFSPPAIAAQLLARYHDALKGRPA